MRLVTDNLLSMLYNTGNSNLTNDTTIGGRSIQPIRTPSIFIFSISSFNRNKVKIFTSLQCIHLRYP